MTSEDSEPLCEKCGNPIGKCSCACPYCGKTGGCECCIGLDAVTGG